MNSAALLIVAISFIITYFVFDNDDKREKRRRVARQVKHQARRTYTYVRSRY